MTDPWSLTCQEVVDLVTAYLEEALTADEREKFEAHLAACDSCVTYLEQIRESVRLAGTLREDDLDPADLAELTAAFRTWRR